MENRVVEKIDTLPKTAPSDSLQVASSAVTKQEGQV
jgi:hypothetical protein